jgi:hypothetical protein
MSWKCPICKYEVNVNPTATFFKCGNCGHQPTLKAIDDRLFRNKKIRYKTTQHHKRKGEYK